ncbi:hypothetical protein ACTNEW_10675 [Blautia sp. HCP3S3_G3]|uniref:hypothetical protein n=1 Tax=Blautia sp. HCP3S3_G3 TaxID=3438913 RepID=UPI003F8AB00E
MLENIMRLQILLYCMTALGAVGAIVMLATNLTYRRILRKTNGVKNLKEKWLNLWKTRDRLLRRMNLLVWIPSLLSTVLLGLSLFLVTILDLNEGLPLRYLYVGTAVPVGLLLLRTALDFAYKEELVMSSLSDYVEQVRTWVEEIPAPRKTDPVLQEEVVEKITSSIRQTAATGSHFSKMLSPEEEEIMREIIREFMQ